MLRREPGHTLDERSSGQVGEQLPHLDALLVVGHVEAQSLPDGVDEGRVTDPPLGQFGRRAR